jgi:hypothetical protein
MASYPTTRAGKVHIRRDAAPTTLSAEAFCGRTADRTVSVRTPSAATCRRCIEALARASLPTQKGAVK